MIDLLSAGVLKLALFSYTMPVDLSVSQREREIWIEPHYPKVGGHQLHPRSTMLHIHQLQSGFGFSDPAMEEALF